MPCIQGELHAGAGKALDGSVKVVHGGHNAAFRKLMHQLAKLGSVFRGIDQFNFTGAFNPHFRRTVDIAIGVTRKGNGLFPARDQRGDAVNQNRRTEYRAVQNAADGRIRAFIHFF